MMKEWFYKQVALILFFVADKMGNRIHYYSAIAMQRHLDIRAKRQVSILIRERRISVN